MLVTSLIFSLLLFYRNLGICQGQACDSVLTESGSIISENFPENYPPYFDCEWTIEAGEYDTVDILFSTFEIEPGESCEFDYLEITAMGNKNRICGKGLDRVGDNGRLRYRGTVVLKMGSDDSVQLKGISLRFRVTPGEPPPTTPAPPTTPPPVVTTPAPLLTCDDDPCENGGECQMMDETEFYCFCEEGFEGDRCEINIDDCVSNPCENGGTCVDGANSWSCECVEGFIGETCGIDNDECRPKPCKNGGTCEDKVNSFVCICANGWTGWDCGTDIDECTPNPCQNYGVCEDHMGYHTCVCHPKFTGQNCTIPVEEPAETPTEPAETPTEPAETPTEPVETPTESAETPKQPVDTPTEQVEKPTDEKQPETPSESSVAPSEIPTDQTEEPIEFPKLGPTVTPESENQPEKTNETPEELQPETTDTDGSKGPVETVDNEAEGPESNEPDESKTPDLGSTNGSLSTNQPSNHSSPSNSTAPANNSTAPPLNNTSDTNKDPIEETEESPFTTVVATVVALTSVTGIISSLLYYCKGATPSRKVQPSGQFIQAEQGDRPLIEGQSNTTSVAGGISPDGGGQLLKGAPLEVESPLSFQNNTPVPSAPEADQLLPRHRLLACKSPETSTIPDFPTAKVSDAIAEKPPEMTSPNKNDKEPSPGNVHGEKPDSLESKTRRESRRKRHKKKSKRNKSPPSFPDVFSPRPSPMTSTIKLPPLRDNLDIIEENPKGVDLLLQDIAPPTYPTQKPQATIFSFSNPPPPDTNIQPKRKRKVAHRSRGPRPKTSATNVEFQPKTSTTQQTFNRRPKTAATELNKFPPTRSSQTHTGVELQPQATKMNLNLGFQTQTTVRPNLLFHQISSPKQSRRYGSLDVGNPFGSPATGQLRPSSPTSAQPPIFLSQLSTKEPNIQNNFRTTSFFSSSRPVTSHVFAESPNTRDFQTHAQFGGQTGATTPVTSSPVRDSPLCSMDEVLESRNPRVNAQPRPRTLAPLNFGSERFFNYAKRKTKNN